MGRPTPIARSNSTCHGAPTYLPLRFSHFLFIFVPGLLFFLLLVLLFFFFFCYGSTRIVDAVDVRKAGKPPKARLTFWVFFYAHSSILNQCRELLITARGPVSAVGRFLLLIAVLSSRLSQAERSWGLYWEGSQ